MTQKHRRLGIISALQQEQTGLIEAMTDVRVERRAMRDYALGSLWGQECICVLSRIGKVAAAATVTTLIERFDVSHILFTGVAGSASTELQVGDVLVADSLIQHDMDATPLFPRFEVPLTGQSHFSSDLTLTEKLLTAAQAFFEQDFLQSVSSDDRHQFQLQRPRVHRGLIGSADQFIDSATRIEELKTHLPDLLAVEMEGAAVAQTCFEFGVPFAVIRTISDAANDKAPLDFMRFIDRVAARYAFGIVRQFCLTPA